MLVVMHKLLVLAVASLGACPQGAATRRASADDYIWCFTDVDGALACYEPPGARAQCEARDAGPCGAY